jgi:hypothetical protein
MSETRLDVIRTVSPNTDAIESGRMSPFEKEVGSQPSKTKA